MSRRAAPLFRLGLLSIVFLVWPSTLLPQKSIRLTPFGERVVKWIRAASGKAAGASNYHQKVQLGLWLWNWGLDVPKLGAGALALTTGNSEGHSILEPAPGALVPIPGAVNSCSTSGGVAIDPFGRFVLTTDSARNLVCVHGSEPETDALTPVPGSPFPTGGSSAERLAVDPSGQFVFVANYESNNVTAFLLDLDTGALDPLPGSPFAAGSAADHVCSRQGVPSK